MTDDAERIPLDLLDPATVRKRSRMVALGAVMVAGFFGGVLGLIAGRVPGLIAVVIVALPLLLLAWSEARRRVWLQGQVLSVRAFGTRSVDLRTADELDLLVTDVRGSRTVGLFVRGGGKAINLALAIYAGTGGRELGVFPLRRLADVLAGRGDPNGLVFSELLVAQPNGRLVQGLRRLAPRLAHRDEVQAPVGVDIDLAAQHALVEVVAAVAVALAQVVELDAGQLLVDGRPQADEHLGLEARRVQERVVEVEDDRARQGHAQRSPGSFAG